MANYRSPGVYVEEVSLLPPSVAEVESAVPAFVGYTEKATNLIADDLHQVPTTINSLGDFELFFGGPEPEDPANITIDVEESITGTATTGFNVNLTLVPANMSKHNLYHAIKLFYANGGGKCYIVSVGKLGTPLDVDVIIDEGIAQVGNEDTPTMIVVPEAVNLTQGEFDRVNQAMINQAAEMKDRFAIMDTFATTVPKTPGSVVADSKTGIDNIPADGAIRRFGAIYYPHLQTAYNHEFDFDALLLGAHTAIIDGAAGAPPSDQSGVALGVIKNNASAMYNAIKAEYSKYTKVLPPSPAMAGVYSRVDRGRGVWKAPANVGLIDVMKPMVSVAQSEQDVLNVNSDTGKSVNVILNSPGFGPLVMGARTLDGNNNEWKYINVRRFFSVVEESIKKSTSWAIFEPNTASTWVKVKAMIENYLYLQWRNGALAGATPGEAYEVRIGLGSTMNSVDVLEGRMIAEIGMAVARPSEFIILKFEQMMQTS